MKRKLDLSLSEDFLNDCRKKFNLDNSNIIARNAIASVGSILSTTDINRVNNINHIFLNSVKSKKTAATNQGASGRCWMFAGLNIFRHMLINALDLEDFEFSETYLFFWDKLERSNMYISWFIDNPNATFKDDSFDYMITDFMSDGGWWNTFINLVSKYGLVPVSAMKQTFQSEDSDDMNTIIQNHLLSTVNHIMKNRQKLDLVSVKQQALEKIYFVLTKFLGEPPKKFDWKFIVEDQPICIPNLTPMSFMDMIIPDTNLVEDFIILTNIPTADMKFNTTYSVNTTCNVEGGINLVFHNLNIQELTKYAMKSIDNKHSVWFSGDVSKHFNPYHASLDDKLNNTEIVFGKSFPFSKGERMSLKDIQSCHAMALTGYNINSKGVPVNWQVENSWGYVDKDTVGMDGFISMSQSWFETYLTSIVIRKEFLSRTLLKEIENCVRITLNPWDSVAPEVFRIRSMNLFRI